MSFGVVINYRQQWGVGEWESRREGEQERGGAGERGSRREGEQERGGAGESERGKIRLREWVSMYRTL